jgi:hypothetical protein
MVERREDAGFTVEIGVHGAAGFDQAVDEGLQAVRRARMCVVGWPGAGRATRSSTSTTGNLV